VKISVLLGTLAFGFYLYGAYPSVSVGDSGEFITAAATLGIPHPPGFPLYTVAGHVFGSLCPLGTWAYRMNVFSALASALSVGLLVWMLRRWSVGILPAVLAGLLLAVMPAHVVNARASEVFSLHTLLVLAVLATAARQKWLLSAFLSGLGSANHQLLVFLVPVLLIVFRLSNPIVDRRLLWGCVWAFLGGFSINLFLFIRAFNTPFLNIGDPDSLERWIRVLRRADYGTFTLALGNTPVRDLPNTWDQILRLLTGIAGQISWMTVAAGLMGLIVWRRHRQTSVLLLGSFFMLGIVFFVLGNLPHDAQSNGLLVRFLIVPALLLLIPAALLAETLNQKTVRIGGSLLLVVPLVWSLSHADVSGFRHDWLAYSYAKNNLKTLPVHTTLFMDGGDDTFYTLAYLTKGEGRRPDIRLHDRGGVVFKHPYGEDFRQLDRTGKEERRRFVEGALIQTDPVFYSTMNPQIIPATAVQLEGLLYAARPAPAPVRPLWPVYDLRSTPPWLISVDGLPDYRSRSLSPFYAYQSAARAWREGSPDEAFLFLKTAYAIGTDALWVKPNVLNTAHRWAYDIHRSKKEMAVRLYRWILQVEPSDAAAARNLQILSQ